MKDCAPSASEFAANRLPASTGVEARQLVRAGRHVHPVDAVVGGRGIERGAGGMGEIADRRMGELQPIVADAQRLPAGELDELPVERPDDIDRLGANEILCDDLERADPCILTCLATQSAAAKCAIWSAWASRKAGRPVMRVT